MNKVTIDYSKCKNSKECKNVCAMNVFEEEAGKIIVKNSDKCIGCKACEVSCSNSAVKVELED